jgi:hypothetical protein
VRSPRHVRAPDLDGSIGSGYGERVLEILTEALFECLMFLELSDDVAVDPDDAVRVMETVMHLLGQLPIADRSELIRLAQAQAVREASSVRREFLLTLPQAFGLVEED